MSWRRFRRFMNGSVASTLGQEAPVVHDPSFRRNSHCYAPAIGGKPATFITFNRSSQTIPSTTQPLEPYVRRGIVAELAAESPSSLRRARQDAVEDFIRENGPFPRIPHAQYMILLSAILNNGYGPEQASRFMPSQAAQRAAYH